MALKEKSSLVTRELPKVVPPEAGLITLQACACTRGGGGGVLHPNAAAAEAAPRVYKLAFRVGSAALGAA